MTKDLALCIYGAEMKREHWVNTTVFIETIAKEVDALLAKK